MADQPRKFWILYYTAQVLIAVTLILLLVWLSAYMYGFGWSSADQQFNWHPLCMSVAFVFLYSESIMLYRAWSNTGRMKLKLIHFGMQFVAFLLVCFAIFCAIYNAGLYSSNNFYSLHSWIGAFTAVCFACQLVFGFFTMLVPGASASFRRDYMPIHIYAGIMIYGCAGTAIVTGLFEDIQFFTSCTSYQYYPADGIICNIIGILMIATGITIAWIITAPEFKRKAPSEETPLVGEPSTPPEMVEESESTAE